MTQTNWNEILTNSSKSLVNFSVGMVQKKPELFDSLFSFMLEEQSPYSQRAARVVYYLMKAEPERFDDYYDKLLDRLPEIHNLSIKFTMLHVFSFCRLPYEEEKLGFLTNFCFDLVEAKIERIALKVYALDVLYRISDIYPEIKKELIFLMEKYSVGAKPAFIARAAKLIPLLKKDLQNKDF